MTATMVADELGLPHSTARSLTDRIGWKYGEVRIKGLRRNFIRRRDLERELAPYMGARPPSVMMRPEIAAELGLPLADTEALLNYVRKRENVLVPVGRRDTFLREAIARYVEAGDVRERVMLAMGKST